MRVGLIVVLLWSSLALAQIRVDVQLPLPVIVVTGELRVGLVPNVVVVEQVREPQGIVVVYRSSQPYNTFVYHDRDLRDRGWTRVKYQAKGGHYRAEYRRGRTKAKLEVQDRKGRVEVRIREG
ncbi:hypothetical protein EWH23_09160 [Meiothermus sp. PNK-Is4]|nr:hypothetical protein DNA98_12150 [Meiothermus sp. Pnk-1]RYM36678.1 hypothetical protein EWH23_09160 [Meiothermus sp. PNK-Is4]